MRYAGLVAVFSFQVCMNSALSWQQRHLSVLLSPSTSILSTSRSLRTLFFGLYHSIFCVGERKVLCYGKGHLRPTMRLRNLPAAIPMLPSMYPLPPSYTLSFLLDHSMLPLKRPCSLSRTERAIADSPFELYMICIA